MKLKFQALAAAALCALVGTAAVAQRAGDAAVAVESSPGQARAVQLVEAVATVVAIDAAKRELTIRDAGGREVPMVLGPEARNLEQIKVGDRVLVQYAESLTLKLMKQGKEIPGAKIASEAGRSPAGARPGGVAAEEVTVTADVIAVNTETKTVTLRGAKREVELRVNDPEQLKLIKVGDQINAIYTQALAVSVKPAPADK